MEITSFDQLDLNKEYSYADYLLWKFEEKVELIKGKIFKMSPAPARKHQKVSWRLNFELGKYFSGNPCEVYYAPFDVRLPSKSNETVITVVQPDICVVCDLTKLDDKGCVGAPDLVIEILSPGNTDKEMKFKFDLYEEAGVKEYWIVNPDDKWVSIYVLQNGRYVSHRPFISSDIIKSQIFEGLEFPAEDIFRD
ncbi:MAG: Uma2 family endonuclease [Bacteroidetes bacterium]|nr:Uma2 family endonuclease [Bacteroidota bacterium]